MSAEGHGSRRPTAPPSGRVALAAIATASGVAACVVAGATAGYPSSFTTTLMVASVPLAIAATARPDTHIPLGVVTVAVWAWLRSAADVATARTAAVAVILLIFHATIALMATTPPSAVPVPAVLQRWLLRAACVTVGTCAVWLLVAALQGERHRANAAGLSGAVIALAAAALWARHRALAAPRVPSPQLTPPRDAT